MEGSLSTEANQGGSVLRGNEDWLGLVGGARHIFPLHLPFPLPALSTLLVAGLCCQDLLRVDVQVKAFVLRLGYPECRDSHVHRATYERGRGKGE